jgi:hypothetical protein
MEDIESITESTYQLLDAPEVGLMAEAGPAVPCLPGLDLSTPSVIDKDSTVENRLDVGVILFVHVLRQVQVKSVGESGVKDDEDGAPVAAQNSTPQISLHACK